MLLDEFFLKIFFGKLMDIFLRLKLRNLCIKLENNLFHFTYSFIKIFVAQIYYFKAEINLINNFI
jgi:hypothetical protein